jgi:hypothetical protein
VRFDAIVQDGQVLGRLGEEQPWLKLPTAIQPGKPFHVQMEWHEGGSAQVQIDGGAARSYPLRFLPDEILIRSGSVDVDISDVAIE